MIPIDLFITAFSRPKYTEQTLKYLVERTTYPYRLFLLINGEDEGNNFIARNMFKDNVFMIVNFSQNGGIHMAWNVALALAESEYFITSDNDIFVPDLRGKDIGSPFFSAGVGEELPDWLTRLVKMMDDRPNYGAISLHPHVFIGAAGIDQNDPEEVKERNMCGAVMRIMRTQAVRDAGGWEHKIDSKRNSEERTICSRLQINGYKVGITSRIRAYHPFGGDKGNWGYPEIITPEMQGHNPELKDYVKGFDKPENYDPLTWLPK